MCRWTCSMSWALSETTICGCGDTTRRLTGGRAERLWAGGTFCGTLNSIKTSMRVGSSAYGWGRFSTWALWRTPADSSVRKSGCLTRESKQKSAFWEAFRSSCPTEEICGTAKGCFLRRRRGEGGDAVRCAHGGPSRFAKLEWFHWQLVLLCRRDMT